MTRSQRVALFAGLVCATVTSASADELCGEGGDGSPICVVREITPAVKAALEKHADRARMFIQLEADVTDAQLKSIAKLPWVTSVSLDRCDKITDITPLLALRGLAYLDLSGTSVKSLAPLAKLPNLTELDLSGTMEASDVGPLAQLKKLRSLKLPMTATKLAPLAGLAKLTHLELGASPDDWAPVVALKQLEELHVSFLEIKNLTIFSGFTRLRVLELSQARSVSDISALKLLPKLQRLRLQLSSVKDLGPLAGLTALEVLVITQAPFADLGPLASLDKLTSLDISDSKVASLAPISKLTTLTDFAATKTAIKDFTPLRASVQTLRAVWISKSSAAAVEWIKKANPAVQIFAM